LAANDNQPAAEVANGDACRVVSGTHAGKTGTIEDRKTSKTGHVTITVRLPDGDKIKTLARNVEVVPR
jgi:ribosomal protein S4E